MSSELIVMTFPDQSEAKSVLKAVRAMRKSPILSLDNAVVAIRDPKGEISLRPKPDQDTVQENRETRILLSLANLILCAPVKNGIDAIIHRGIDGRFATEIARIMKKHSSALFILTGEDSVHDAGEMRNTLAQFKGRIHQTSLPSEVEAYL